MRKFGNLMGGLGRLGGLRCEPHRQRCGTSESASRTGRDVGRVEVGRKIVYFSGIGRYGRYLIFSNISIFLYRSYIIPILFV